jgi:hypothetical protein
MDIASASAVRWVAVTRETSATYATPPEGRLWLFNLSDRRCLRSFAVRYDFGGRRLAVSPDGSRCFVGCYDVEGMGAYLADGAEAWRRKDLKAIQQLEALPAENAVFCGRDGASHLLCAETGKTMDKPRGVKAVYARTAGPEVILAGPRFELHAPYGRCRWKASRSVDFREMDCAFSRGEVAIAEGRGPVRCFDLVAGTPLWSHQPPAESHFLSLTYREQTGCFVGLWRSLRTKEPYRLFHLSARTGTVERDVQLPESVVDYCFCESGDVLFTQDLSLISTETAVCLYRFEDAKCVDAAIRITQPGT